ncbi:hypothetical protein B0T21DRAFT_327272 [Apiosordaria backusii]|uniref:Aminoglycoside phosphotransferase domain-containing protein n=1 Tax=Apiosordaria backusii TaxID=314023 RepID=A0AA40K0W1_9PEZI|nr:hypothetical protein B0T21DRAFT_327272 [Apiosordaria backusii]
MGDSPQRGHQDHLVEQEIEKAHELANTLTLNRLTSKHKGNPAVDLAHILKQQANAYPQLRGSLEQAVQRKAATRDRERAPERSAKETTQTSCPDAQPEMGDFLIDGPIQITHPLAELAMGINKAIEKGKILWKLHGTVVLGLGASEVVKIGTSLDLDEVTNLSYINAYVPAVPAPSCLGCLTAKQRTYFFMSRSDGVTLETLWADLSIEDKLSIKAQLNTIFHSLRKALRPPHLSQDGMPKFGSFASAICKDMRRQQRMSAATIRNEAQFNDFLCHQTGRSATPWVRMIRSAMRDDHRLVMTHADLHPRNIMVRWEGCEEEGTGRGRERRVRISALLDWESSGWYPEYWEFVKALSTINVRGKMADWLEYLPTEAIGTWPVELSIDSLLDRWLG